MNLTLVVSNINKSYSRLPVLKSCSFSFDKRDVYVLIGPNGSGKSTFFRICSLIEEPDSGMVNYFSGDSDVRKDIGLRRRISLVLPKIGVFNTTVFKNVAYGLKVRGMSRRDIQKRAEQALELVGLVHKKNMNALALSSGESQRLGIARAMVIEPEILFLDEPTASLDPHNTAIIEETIQKIREQKKITIIMITHDVFQAQRLADIVLFMYEGTIIDHGASKEVFERLKNKKIYRFITAKMVY